MKPEKNIMQPAWDLFSQGNLAGAEQAAAQAMQKLNNMAIHPIPDIMVLKAFYLCRLHRYKDARSLFANVLEVCPDDAYAQQGYLLTLKDEFKLKSFGQEVISEKVAKQQSGKNGRLLLGLGTGRSGSTTLAKLWAEQKNCYCSHEHPPRLSWRNNSSRFAFHQNRFDLLKSGFEFVGDVSHWWLPYIETIMDYYNDIRIVVLKRDCNATVDSFIKIKGGTGKGAINHWIDHGGKFWSKNIWDECYPKYATSKMQEAIEYYWEEYYTIVDNIINRFPESVRVYDTEHLSEPEVQSDILSFCGFIKPKLVTDLHLNRGDALDGERMY